MKSCSFAKPSAVNYINERHYSVIVVQIKFVIIVAELALIIIVANSLAVKSLLLVRSDWLTFLSIWSLDVPIQSVLLSGFSVIIDFHTVIVEGLWTHVWETIVLHVVDFFLPSWFVKFIGVVKIEGNCLKLNWNKGLWIEVSNVKTWWFSCVSSC